MDQDNKKKPFHFSAVGETGNGTILLKGSYPDFIASMAAMIRAASADYNQPIAQIFNSIGRTLQNTSMQNDSGQTLN